MFLRPAEERHGEGSSERGQEPSSLVRFLARAPDHVAVSQPKSSDFGDIHDTEAKHLEPTSEARGGLLSDSGLKFQDFK